MKLNKEISLVVVALTFLGSLIGIWWHSVYNDEVQSIKDQTDIVFFRALEEAEKNLVLRRSDLPKDIIKHSFHSKSRITESIDDSLARTEMVVIKMRVDSADEEERINLSELFGVPNSPNDTSTSITISINSKASTLKLEDDETYTVDLDSAQIKLIEFFDSGLEQSDLSNLEFEVLKQGMDSSFNAAFITQKGKVGNAFLDGGEFIAAVDYHPRMILMKMIPELLFGTFLFLLVTGAFVLILKNLRNAKLYAQLKDDFVSNMTHELKTPISVVNVAVEALSDFNILNDKKKSGEYLSISKRELNKLDKLVDQILTINKEKSDFDTNSEVINIIDELEDVCSEFAIHKSRLITEFGEQDMFTIMAPEHFRRAMNNIIDNAFKYGPNEGKVIINIQSKADMALITVKDEGNTLSSNEASRIFDKFYRVPNSNIHNVKGHGLGLYYAKKHFTEAGGDIKVSTRDNECIFTISLPLKQ